MSTVSFAELFIYCHYIWIVKVECDLCYIDLKTHVGFEKFPWHDLYRVYKIELSLKVQEAAEKGIIDAAQAACESRCMQLPNRRAPPKTFEKVGPGFQPGRYECFWGLRDCSTRLTVGAASVHSFRFLNSILEQVSLPSLPTSINFPPIGTGYLWEVKFKVFVTFIWSLAYPRHCEYSAVILSEVWCQFSKVATPIFVLS